MLLYLNEDRRVMSVDSGMKGEVTYILEDGTYVIRMDDGSIVHTTRGYGFTNYKEDYTNTF